VTAAVAPVVLSGSSPNVIIRGVGAFAAGVNLMAQIDAASREKIDEDAKEVVEGQGGRKRALSPVTPLPRKVVEAIWVWLIVHIRDIEILKRMGCVWDREKGQWKVSSLNKNMLAGKLDR
jgi:hypothetical protein